MKWLTLTPALLLSLSLCAQKPAANPNPNAQVEAENRQRQAEADRQNRIVDSFNVASRTFNDAVRLFNDFNNYRNDKFKPTKPDAEIQQMLDSAQRQFFAAKAEAGAIVLTPADTRIQQPLKQLKDAIAQIDPHFREAQEWLTKYFSKSKLGRKTMFYKFSWL
jgi:hypothetical protein